MSQFECFFPPVQLAVASEFVNIVQIKRNESNCPAGRNLDKLNLKNAGSK